MPPGEQRDRELPFSEDTLCDLALDYYLHLPRETLQHLLFILYQSGIEPSSPFRNALVMRGEKISGQGKPRRKWRHE